MCTSGVALSPLTRSLQVHLAQTYIGFRIRMPRISETTELMNAKPLNSPGPPNPKP